MQTDNFNTDISLLEQPEKPSEKAIEALKDWRDSETDEWMTELLDAIIMKLEHEVDQ